MFPFPPTARHHRALAFLILLSAGSGWADECEQLPSPSVTIKRLEAPFTVNTQYSYKTLTQMGAEIARPGHLILGLTRSRAVVRFAATTPTRIDRTGRWECVSPQLTLTYGFSPMTVYVAKEFPEGGCAYQQIYEHELRHVKAYLTHLASIEKDLSDTLNRRFATGSPWRGPVGQKHELLQQELAERWQRYIQREIEGVNAAQALIDTPEEYERVANTCNGEIKNRIR